PVKLSYEEEKPSQNTVALETFTDLRKRWQFVASALSGEPAQAPWVHAPRVWRELLERLLRAEEVSRAGIVPDLSKLQDLQNAIQRRREEPPASLANTLAGAGTLPKQLSAAKREDLKRRFDAVWSAEKFDPKDFGNLLKNVDVGEVRAGRMHVLRLLIERAAEDPEHNLAHAADAVPEVEDKGASRPAEAHFLLMLKSHQSLSEKEEVPWKPDWAAIKLALSVRQRAEQAA